METFITTVCTNDLGTPEITTCEYGGVLPYTVVFTFLVIMFTVTASATIKLVKKLL